MENTDSVFFIKSNSKQSNQKMISQDDTKIAFEITGWLLQIFSNNVSYEKTMLHFQQYMSRKVQLEWSLLSNLILLLMEQDHWRA